MLQVNQTGSIKNLIKIYELQNPQVFQHVLPHYDFINYLSEGQVDIYETYSIRSSGRFE